MHRGDGRGYGIQVPQGGGGNGGFSIGVSGAGTASGGISIGGAGESGGNSEAVTLNSSGMIDTDGDKATGLFAQSVGASFAAHIHAERP